MVMDEHPPAWSSKIIHKSADTKQLTAHPEVPVCEGIC